MKVKAILNSGYFANARHATNYIAYIDRQSPIFDQNGTEKRVLSELAIQQAILCQVIAHELEVNPRALDNYRRAAVEYLKMNDRVFRLEDIVEE